MGNYFSNTETTQRYHFGWKKDKEDKRDIFMDFDSSKSENKNIDLRTKFPPIYTQGELGSCTANAIAACYQFDEMKQKEDDVFIPSRLFIYYNERQLEGNVYEDAGATIRDGIKTINRIGVIPEDHWPYNIEKFTEQPPMKCYSEARNHKAVKYRRLRKKLNVFKSCLDSGLPFVFGFIVFESFKTEKVKNTGTMPLPEEDEEILGGHAVVAVGYDDSKECIIVRNSWGEEWGDKGYFYMPYEFITNKEWCEDFWVVEKVRDE